MPHLSGKNRAISKPIVANRTGDGKGVFGGRVGQVRRALAALVAFFASLKETAEQLSPVQRWYRILSRALIKYLKGRQLRPPELLPAAQACT